MENYTLPVKYTEEEREAYACWGLKKVKIMMPLSIVVFTIDFASTIAFVMWLLGMYRGDYWLYQMLLWRTEELLGVRYVIVLILSGILIKGTDLVFHMINGRPPEEKWIQVNLREDGLLLCLEERKGQGRYGETLAQERKDWQELDALFDEAENAIRMGGQTVVIGANTVETIYPEGARMPWLEYPDRHAREIVSAQELHRISKGYLAGLKAKEQEARYIRDMLI